MERVVWKPGNMVYPAPAALVSCAGLDGKTNFMTAAWTGNVSSDPVYAFVSIRPERYSYNMIKESGEFVINLTTKAIADKTDTAGVKSGRDIDKWKELKLTPGKASKLNAPIILESPVNVECKVEQIINLGVHDMFLGKVVAVDVDPKYIDKDGRFDLASSGLLVYAHGQYYGLGEHIGKFGYSVRKH